MVTDTWSYRQVVDTALASVARLPAGFPSSACRPARRSAGSRYPRGLRIHTRHLLALEAETGHHGFRRPSERPATARRDPGRISTVIPELEIIMSTKGSVYKRCGCRIQGTGKRFG